MLQSFWNATLRSRPYEWVPFTGEGLGRQVKSLIQGEVCRREQRPQETNPGSLARESAHTLVWLSSSWFRYWFGDGGCFIIVGGEVRHSFQNYLSGWSIDQGDAHCLFYQKLGIQYGFLTEVLAITEIIFDSPQLINNLTPILICLILELLINGRLQPSGVIINPLGQNRWFVHCSAFHKSMKPGFIMPWIPAFFFTPIHQLTDNSSPFL